MNVLISSAGRRVELVRAFRDTLALLGIPGRVLACDTSDLSPAGHAADGFFHVPHARSAEYVPTVHSLCQEHGVGLLVPTIDPELMPYAGAVGAFARTGTTIAVPSPEAVEIAEDKRLTLAFFHMHGIRTLRQFAPDAVLNDKVTPTYPLIVKPANGSASVGVVVAHTKTELRAAGGRSDVVVQEHATGAEHTIDMFFDREGRLREAVPRVRLEVRAGEVSKARTVRAEPLRQLAEQVAEALPPTFGVINLQAFWDGETPPVASEINARFGGGFPLTHAAGAPFVRWLIESAVGRPLTPAPAPWEDGLLMLRYDAALLVSAKDRAVAE